MISTVREVIDAFGGPASYARHVGMTAGAAKQARRRNSLNVRWIAPTARAAEKLEIPLTETQLLEIAADAPSEASAA